MSRVLRKPAFCICENKDADQLRGNRYTDPKFQASSHLMCPVCMGPGQKPRRPVFSERGSYKAHAENISRKSKNKIQLTEGLDFCFEASSLSEDSSELLLLRASS